MKGFPDSEEHQALCFPASSLFSMGIRHLRPSNRLITRRIRLSVVPHW